MASANGYHCSFCQMTLLTEKGWLNHLLKPDHQAQARENLNSWDLETKERVLVVFGKFSVATESVLGAFSEQGGPPTLLISHRGRSNLSGFVWNEKRPRVGFLLFESREKVDEVVNGLNGKSQMRINSYQLLQLRRAADYLDLEWEGLITQDFHSEFVGGMKTKVKTEMDVEIMPISKRLKLAMPDSNACSSHHDDKRKAGVTQTEPCISNLVSQLDLICRGIEIGNDAWAEALVLMEKLQLVIATSTKFKRCRLLMFRHWYLKLRTQETNELILYFDVDGILDSSTGGNVRTSKEHQSMCLCLTSLFAFSDSHHLVPAVGIDGNDMTTHLGFEKRSALHLRDASTNIKFTLVLDPLYAVEVQTCRLLNYLLDFDPRARPFLTLIFYWAEQNHVKMSGPVSIQHKLTHAFPPEPTGLEWMVIFFLCHKRILPSPREIQERAQKPEVLYRVTNFTFDIGFPMDPQFAEEWAAANTYNCPIVGTNEFVLHLVELSKEFFTFYGNLHSSPQHWVLNTRDGELLRKGDLLESNLTFATRLTKEELDEFRSPRASITKRHKRLNGLANRRFTILHPLIIQWIIPCDEGNFFKKVCSEMLASARIIGSGLPTLGGEDTAENKKAVAKLQNLFRKVTLEEIRLKDQS